MSRDEKIRSCGANRCEITVVICTYNRAALLDGAVRSACEQTLDRSRYEVLVVDNNSTDRTATLIAELMERYPHLRYCREGVQGLSAARNRGMRESSAGYLGFLDDDAKAPEHWLERAMHIIEERAPGVFGGPYYPFYESPKPAWFLDEFGTRKMAERARPLRPNEDLSGGNLFIRRELLGSMGGFQPDMGMKGGTLAYGEETLLQWQIQRRFPHEVIYYEPDLFVYHLVRADKMSFRWRARQRFAQGRYNFRLRHQWMDEPVTTSQVLVLSKDVVRVSIKRLSLDLVRRDRARYPALRSYLFGKAFDSLYICGYLTEWAAKRLLHP